MAYAIADQARPAGWLRNAPFDLGFVAGIAAMAAAAGTAAVLAPALLWPIVIADLWLLGRKQHERAEPGGPTDLHVAWRRLGIVEDDAEANLALRRGSPRS